jgi:hypothetical protein
MSGTYACPASRTRPGPLGPAHRHVVTVWRANYSAFSGYRWTSSAYSEVWCIDTHQVWRTKAAYVDDLPDATPDDKRKLNLR